MQCEAGRDDLGGHHRAERQTQVIVQRRTWASWQWGGQWCILQCEGHTGEERGLCASEGERLRLKLHFDGNVGHLGGDLQQAAAVVERWFGRDLRKSS